MYDSAAHPLLAQVPLTVSPFLSLPTTPTLPYTYKSLPTTLPPSSTPKEAYITAPHTNQSFTPAALLASTAALRTHLDDTRQQAARDIAQWEEGIRARELAEKRRVAPGWLDRDEKMLEPERRGTGTGTGTGTGPGKDAGESSSTAGGTRARDSMGDGGAVGRAEVEGSAAALELGEGRVSPPGLRRASGMSQGEELDRAFGAMGVK